MEEAHVLVDAFLRLSLEYLEQERQLRHLDGLGVEIRAEDVVQQNLLSLGRCELPVAPRPAKQGRSLSLRPLLRPAGFVGLKMPVEQVLVRAQEKRARSACRVQNSQFCDIRRFAPIDKLADRRADDMLDDVGRGVIDAACLADLRLLLDPCLVTGGEAYHLAQKALVHLTEDVGDPMLAQHLHSLIMFQRLAIANGWGWQRFINMVDQAMPRKGDTLQLPFNGPNA